MTKKIVVSGIQPSGKLHIGNYLGESFGRIMSLTDPTKKMSKSDPNDNSRINLSDEADAIRKKIGKAVSDEAGLKNLHKIYYGCGGQALPTLVGETKMFKEKVINQIIFELGK